MFIFTQMSIPIDDNRMAPICSSWENWNPVPAMDPLSGLWTLIAYLEII